MYISWVCFLYIYIFASLEFNQIIIIKTIHFDRVVQSAKVKLLSREALLENKYVNIISLNTVKYE